MDDFLIDDFLNAPLPAIGGQGLILFAAIDEEETVFQQDGLLMHPRRLGLPAERVFERVLQNPDEYLMPRYALFEGLPAHWEAFSGIDYLGMQQHLEEESEAPEEVEDMDNDEEDLDDHGETTDCAKTLSQDVDAVSSAGQPVAKRVGLSVDDRMLKDAGSSSSSVPTFGLKEPGMPGASPSMFGSIRERVTSETLNIG